MSILSALTAFQWIVIVALLLIYSAVASRSHQASVATAQCEQTNKLLQQVVEAIKEANSPRPSYAKTLDDVHDVLQLIYEQQGDIVDALNSGEDLLKKG